MKSLTNTVYFNLMTTAAFTLICVLIYLLFNFLVTKRVETHKKQRQYRARMFYIMLAIYLILLIRIWVESFSHLFTMLGLVGAALVITNKETVMNLVGWLIIMWRGLFSEGEYIKLEDYSGYVHSIGLFYFNLSSVKPMAVKGRVLGELVRIPNGMIINTPLINYSRNETLHQQTYEVVFHPKCDIITIREALLGIIQEILETATESYLSGHPEKKLKQLLKREVVKSPKVACKLTFEKPGGIFCQVTYSCYYSTKDQINEQFWEHLLQLSKSNPSLKLQYFGD